LKITVFLGGSSSERDVSLVSGLRISAALRTRGHEVSLVDPATGAIDAAGERALRENASSVKTAPPTLEALAALAAGSPGGMRSDLASLPSVRSADVVFLALHGGQGEDGTIQALLDMAGVRYTGSGHLASALAMDKDLSKTLFRAAGVQTADWVMVTEKREGRETRDGRQDKPSHVSRSSKDLPDISHLGLPVVVKPSKQGSTVGLSVVKSADQLEPAIVEALKYDDEVMIERFVAGREFTVGILGGEAFPVGEIIPKHEIYDYECKYTPGMAREVFPAELPAKVSAEMQRQARLAFAALKLGGCARIDFRMTSDFECYCLEANTLPGMTELSLIPQGAKAAGIDFAELCERIARLAIE
jgi:D-alanine-D-alanine ligase